ncbi:Fe-S cluster assembly protein HesB [bacterium]|nr:Fe-S cluster assembly protein HesB [bacterium]
MEFCLMEIQEIQQKILHRYEKEGRDFPRRKTTDPYQIHLCEVMSQQTQLSRVLPYRTKWLERFPNYESVANASKQEILTYRSGLGFNRRGLNFRECAKKVCSDFHGKLPLDREKLLQLPGIGAYTSAAICAFADNQPIPVIDTNIRRVLIFLFSFPESLSIAELEKKSKSLIPS